MRVVAVVVALTLAGCSKPPPNPQHGEPLAFGMKSQYLRQNLVHAWSQSNPVEVLVDEPPIQVVWVGRVSERSATPGELMLVFLDDALMEVCYFPDDFAAYVAAGRAKPESDSTNALVFHTATDRLGRRYVSWSDSRMLQKSGAKADPCG